MLDNKLNSNLASIEDFLYLMVETKKEATTIKEISSVLAQVETQLCESKVVIEDVVTRRNSIKDQIEQVDQKVRLQRQKVGIVSTPRINGTL
jgi:orotate phosphoribosyltransferase-like protein